jgi:hypothetical protein
MTIQELSSELPSVSDRMLQARRALAQIATGPGTEI